MLQLQNFHALPVPLQTAVQTTIKLNLPNHEIKPIRRQLPMNVVNCLYISNCYCFFHEISLYNRSHILCPVLKFACVQTAISFVAHRTKEIEDICTQEMCKYVQLK